MKVKVEIKPVTQIIRRHGLDKDGQVQLFHTMNVNRRITKYMPFLTGTLATKLKRVRSNTEIEVTAPYARYQYFGKVMVNSKTGKGPALIPGVGYRYRKGATLEVTKRPLEYTKTKHPLAGPYWDRALAAAEGEAMAEDLQRFIERR